MTPASPLPKRSSEKAAALIIVLAFVVLFTALAVAYLSRATTDRQLAHTSFHDTDADLLARSALDIVVGDFKWEIFNGSTKTTLNGITIYVPKDTGSGAAANMIPQRSGGSSLVPNLIRRSIRYNNPGEANAMPTPGVPSRASVVNSQDNPSANDRYVTSTRWNGHYLVPKGDPTTTDSSPIPAFTHATPDWVFVKAYDPVTQASPGPTVIPLPDPLVVGRYAYAIYDEGGLLDANLVGLPSPTPGAVTIASPSPSRTVYPSRKGTVAFADLTALPLSPDGSTPNPQTISKIVGWRNYATTNVPTTAAFPDLSPSPSPFVTYFLDNSRDFLTVNTLTNSGRTDQAFTTRAELIQLLVSLGDTNPNANITNLLQYLGTFSRELNAPTWQAASNPTSQRFQLDKISLLGSSPTPAPSGQTVADIKRYFGLQWSTTTNRWQYVGTQGSSLKSSIDPPAASPPPDFFQILNYAIPGKPIDKILSLGAAIIDEYDHDVPNEVTTGIEYAPAPSVAWGAEDANPVIPMGSPVPSPSPTATVTPALNRPFQNVGELGYAYNPITGNTLDFHTSGSSDAALLDLFTYNTADNTATYGLPYPLRPGPVNINTRNTAIIAAILTGTSLNEASPTTGVSASDAMTAATSIAAATLTQPAGYAGGHPVGRQDLARIAANAITNPPFTTNDETRETIARALSDTTQTRTWGLLIDLVAQTGHYPPNLTQNPQPADLPKFVVEGEKHYWAHVAIDRFTGQVIATQIEVVTK